MYPEPQPGNILFYDTPDDIVDWVITRTGPAAHVEIYEGGGQSLASRNGIGVNRYPLRTSGLIAVVWWPVDMPRFSAWFETVKGEGYDWVGLEGFVEGTSTGKPNEMFCSNFIAQGGVRQGVYLVNKFWPTKLANPTDLLKSPLGHWLWVDGSKMWL